MALSNEYQKQINAFCDENCTTSTEEILMKAREKETMTTYTEKNVVNYTQRKRRKLVWRLAVPAACILLMGTTVMAATGQFQNLFRTVFEDDTTADIVDKGYLYEINQSQEDENFRIDLIAVTGDANTPKLVFDVYLKDKELAARNDRIRMLVYNLGVEQFENELDKYAPGETYGTKDKEIDNLYHFSMTGFPVWMTSGEPVVVSVWQVTLDLNNDIKTEYNDVNLEYRFTPPAGIYHPVSDASYENITFSHGGIDYNLVAGTFGSYNSEFTFIYDFVGTSLAGDETDYAKLETKLQENWLELVDTFTLVVDDKEYKVNSDNKGYTWCDVNSEVLQQNRCIIHPYFPAFNYDEAKSIILKSEEQSFRLK